MKNTIRVATLAVSALSLAAAATFAVPGFAQDRPGPGGVVAPADEGEAFVRDFDLREKDAVPPTFWTRIWQGRADCVAAIIRRRVPAGGLVVDVG